MAQYSPDGPQLDIDMANASWFIEKVNTHKWYAQNLYAAMCNMDWQKIDVMPILKNETWSISWRGAGGLVASLIGEGDYMDWYCSGMGGMAYDRESEAAFAKTQFVNEGTVTDVIREDLAKLGWRPVG